MIEIEISIFIAFIIGVVLLVGLPFVGYALGELIGRIRNPKRKVVSDEYESLSSQIKDLSFLMTNPRVLGRWGEIQIERILESVGLTKNVHYTTQVTTPSGGRPDFVVHMPNNLDVIIDSKVPLEAYQKAAFANNNSTREQLLNTHSRTVKSHLDKLANKEYFASLPNAVDFVIMVIPDHAYQPAMERRPELFDYGMNKNVVLCTQWSVVRHIEGY